MMAYSQWQRATILTRAVILLLISLITACQTDPPYIDPCGQELFGLPIEQTGLTREQCKPFCACKGFYPKVFRPQEIDELKRWQLTGGPDSLTSNPYTWQSLPPVKGVCAIIIDDPINRLYHLKTFASVEQAKHAGAYITHFNACGSCSSLQDLAVYASQTDVGTPVKVCAIQNFNKPFEQLVACIEAIGFSHQCALIWAYNARNTQQACLQYCLNNDPYQNPDGSLSPCLECDEQQSGPVFKAVAGRTRRNSGLPSSICRKCDTVAPVKHEYPFLW